MNNYIKIKVLNHPFADKDGNVLKHRLIMEKKLGRYLLPYEVVHHLDFNSKNNDIENLMLFPNNSAHIKFHLKLKQFGMTQPILTQIKNWENEYGIN